GDYAVRFVESTLPNGAKFTQRDQGGDEALDSDAAANGFTSCITLAPGENNDTIDAGINAPPIAKLGDFVFEDANRNGIQDNGEAGVQGVTVQLYRCVNGVRDAFVTEVTTDANGEYLFDNLQPGEYQVEFVASSLPSGFVFSPQDQGGDDAADSDADPTSGVTDCLTLQAGDDIRTVDAGINQPAKASLGDRVFFDTDGDGVQDPGENGVPNITVELFTCVGGTPDTKVSDTTTDANGMYLFADLDAGDYAVRFVESTLPNGAKFTQRDQGGDEALDSDADPATGFTACVTLNNGDVNRDLDAGVVEGIDLELAKIVDQPAPSLNDNVVFTITVLNNSNPDATGVIVTDDFPAGLTPISTDAGAAATINGQVVTWDIGTVDGQASVSINITASVDAEATLRNCAEVTAANEDDVDSTPNDGQGDDFACATVTSDGSSGGGGGGVESDGNMASKLANRLFERRQNAMFATGNRRVASPVIMAANDFAPRISSNVNGVNIATFFPEDGPQESQPFVVTPDDLLGITNATSVFATDYLRVDGRRLGAVIGLTSPSGSIYDHAKTTCDRLGGGRLDDVQRIAVGDQTYILSTLFHPTGHVDYAISFVAYRTGTSYVIDSQFAPDIYEVPAGVDEVLNFQVWTVAPRYSAHLVEEIIAKLDAEGDVSFLNETTAPSVPPVYIESGAYRNGVLTLNVVNTTGAAYTTTLRGSTTDTETEASNQLRMPFERTLSVPAPVAPARSVQIQVETGSIFDAELALADGDVALDRVYWADGPWGTSEGAATITEFTTFAQDEAPVEAGTFRIERDAYITGTVTDHAALFRYIRPNAQPVDLSSFDALTFTAYGQGRLRVVLEQAANTDGDHYAFDVRLTNTPRTFTIAYDDFYQSLGTTGFNGEGITTMVFYMIGDGQISQPFDLVLEGVAFVGGSSSVAVEDPTETPDGFALAQNYPNPFNPSTTIGFMVPQAAPVSLVVYDLLGRPVQTLVDGTVAAGAHEVVFEAGNLPSGTYVYRLQAGGQTFTRTLVLMK
ncbi:MAG: SdrD B-like domain-containing protein, partial [Bacteroidota bacterium]